LIAHKYNRTHPAFRRRNLLFHASLPIGGRIPGEPFGVSLQKPIFYDESRP